MFAALKSFPPRHAEVMRRRLAGDTLREVADALGVTVERARQLEIKTTARLRRKFQVAAFHAAVGQVKPIPARKSGRAAVIEAFRQSPLEKALYDHYAGPVEVPDPTAP